MELIPGILAALTGIIFIVMTLRDPRRFRNGLLFLAFFTLMTFCCLIYASEIPQLGVFGIVLIAVWIFLILIVPFLLIINGFTMLRKEGFSLVNILSLVFGFMILAGEFSIYAGMTDFYQSGKTVSTVIMGFGSAVFYVCYIFLALMFYTIIIRIIPRRAGYDYVIALGAGLLGGERVSRLLGDRLDKAAKVYKRSYTACKIICSGGQGPDEKLSEAEAMKNYLIEKRQIPAEDILLEDRSTDTMENLVNSKALIESRKGRKITAVVTSSYHIFRAMVYARRISFPVTGIGSHVAFYYWPSAMIREYAALVKYYFTWYFLGMVLFVAVMVSMLNVIG